MPFIKSKYAGKCRTCGEPYDKGAEVWWVRDIKGVQCKGCKATALPAVGTLAERPGAHARALPIDIVAREITGRVLACADGMPLQYDTPERVIRDLAQVLRGEYAIEFRRSLTFDPAETVVP